MSKLKNKKNTIIKKSPDLLLKLNKKNKLNNVKKYK